MSRLLVAAATLLAVLTTPVLAHVTLEAQEASPGSAYKAVLRVPHGCKGSPTTRVRVQIPEGVIAVKPMPKAGWQLDTAKGAFAKSYDYYGTPTADGVKEISWSGGRLPDEFYEEFVFRAFLTKDSKPGTTLYFPVVQDCETGTDRWIEIPADGKSADDYEAPAPGLKLVPKR
ncbi:MAG: DUF1775 domain-containing protein [Alsobacter sp.]